MERGGKSCCYIYVSISSYTELKSSRSEERNLFSKCARQQSLQGHCAFADAASKSWAESAKLRIAEFYPCQEPAYQFDRTFSSNVNVAFSPKGVRDLETCQMLLPCLHLATSFITRYGNS